MSKTKKKWKPVPGETYYFISHLDTDAPPEDGDRYVDLNGIGFLYVGDAECWDPDFDIATNCFRTKAEGKRALSQIANALKGKFA